MKVIFSLSNVNGNGTIDPSGWNAVADVVGCGTGSVPNFFSEANYSLPYTNSATTDAQLSCMKAAPFRKLEDAVISTNAGFLPSFDSESPLFLRHPVNSSMDVQT